MRNKEKREIKKRRRRRKRRRRGKKEKNELRTTNASMQIKYVSTTTT